MEKFKIIDAHTHCLETADLKAEFKWFDNNFDKKVRRHVDYLRHNKINKAVVYILDENAFAMNCRLYQNLIFALLIDFRQLRALDNIRKAKNSGFKGIKILTYEQQVEKKDYQLILKIAREIEKQKMFLTICATFGGADPYQYDALALARYLLQKGYQADMVLAHSGGSRIKEAALIAGSSPNVYFDTSFTTAYWRGSSVISDLAGAINEFPSRYFFGSDSPNIKFTQAKRDSLALLKGSTLRIKNNFFYNNAFNFLKKYE